ncbi:MAG: amino acid ABC transporter permease [Alphaproteobacteria bacterium]|nr:amino acid ABC transporter permease [Alphaproteobacteria bacterium]
MNVSPPRRRPVADALNRVPWWLVATVIGALLVAWAMVADQGYNQIFSALVRGVLTTLYVTLLAFFFASVLGLLIAVMRTSPSRVLREIATFYTEIIRGIPILVMLFYIAFVGAPWLVEAVNFIAAPVIGLGWIEPLTVRQFDFTWRAIFALTIAYSAFLAEIFRAGIQAVDVGQVEAGKALGLRPWHRFRHVVAPQAIRTILPPYGNDFVAMIKDSALVSALGVQDITQLGKVYSASTFKFFETYNIVAFLYLIMTLSLSLVVRAIEHRMNRPFGS